MTSPKSARVPALAGLAITTSILIAGSLMAWQLGLPARVRALATVKEAKASPTPASTIAVRADGRVSTYPNGSVIVGTEKGGTLSKFKIVERDSVKRGDVIAEIDSAEQQAGIAEAHARIHETNVSIAFYRTQVAKSAKLADAGVISRDEHDRNQHQLDNAIAQRNVAEATVRRLTTAEAKSKVRAPIDGVILERHADEGEMLSPGSRLATIADLSKLRIEAEVDEFDAAKVVVGAPVTITTEGQQKSWTGTVEEVPNAITRRHIKPDDPTRATDTRILLVKIKFAEPATQLRLGQRVEVAIGK